MNSKQVIAESTERKLDGISYASLVSIKISYEYSILVKHYQIKQKSPDSTTRGFCVQMSWYVIVLQ